MCRYAEINLKRDNPSVFPGYVFVQKKLEGTQASSKKMELEQKDKKNILCLNSRNGNLLSCILRKLNHSEYLGLS